MLRFCFVTGCEPDKWVRRFQDRTEHGGMVASAADDPLSQVAEGSADVALVRGPVTQEWRETLVADGYHCVALYEEQPGVGMPKDHTLTLLEAVTDEDLAGEHVLYRSDGAVDPAAVCEALKVVAANVGVVLAPRPLLKVLSGRQVEHRAWTNGEPTVIALVWRRERDGDDIQDFVGICRGRKPSSARQSDAAPAERRRDQGGKQRRGNVGKRGEHIRRGQQGAKRGKRTGKAAGHSVKNVKRGRGPKSTKR